MEKQRDSDRLARYIIILGAIVLAGALCWLLRNIIIYVLAAAVLALMAMPLKKLMARMQMKGKGAPQWLLAIIALLLLTLLLLALVANIIPIVYKIVETISANLQTQNYGSDQLGELCAAVNMWVKDNMAGVASDFSVETALTNFFRKNFNVSSISSAVGTVASTVGSVGVGVFATIFISYFFVKDETLFPRLVSSLVPEENVDKAVGAIDEIQRLLSRYFLGMFAEVMGVTLLNFLGLWLIARLNVGIALGIAFMAGILNVVPYLGPWIGTAIGVVLGLVLKFSVVGANAGLPGFALVLVAIFVVTQLVDNYLLQPYIYSKSLKTHPLEIFIVLIFAGSYGGILGMLLAIPGYMVLRVIAFTFFPEVRFVRFLSGAAK